MILQSVSRRQLKHSFVLCSVSEDGEEGGEEEEIYQQRHLAIIGVCEPCYLAPCESLGLV